MVACMWYALSGQRHHADSSSSMFCELGQRIQEALFLMTGAGCVYNYMNTIIILLLQQPFVVLYKQLP